MIPPTDGSVLPWIIAGAGLVAIGLSGYLFSRHLLRRLLAFNITGSGALLMVLALADTTLADTAHQQVPSLLIFSGILVAVSATALGTALLLRWHRRTGRTDLPRDPAP